MLKRRATALGLWMLIAGLSLGLSGCPCLNIQIRDPGLESAIRASLGMPFGCLTEADLLRVTEIQAANYNIRNLQGIQFCRNLTTLNLKNNQIASITPLASLTNLTFLDLGDNRVVNIEALAGLFFLNELYLDGNEIYNFAPLIANAQNGGIGDGSLVVLPDTILNAQREIQDIYTDDINALLERGVRLFVDDRP